MPFTPAFIKTTFQAKWGLGEEIIIPGTSYYFVIYVLTSKLVPRIALKTAEQRQQVEDNEECYKWGHEAAGLVRMEPLRNCKAAIMHHQLSLY